MAPIPTRGVVAVTGSAGFLGGWVVRELLDRGYRVRACVRNAADPARCDFLNAMPGFASGRLTLHSADLDQPGCFDEIFKGCHGVAHISHIGDYNDQDYVRRTCDHIIASVNASGSVNRVVVTSSVAAAEASGAWDAIIVCPGDNVGPILSAHQKYMGPWQSLIRQMLEGACMQTGVYRPWMTVDVRDDALCHLRLLESTRVRNGERYIAWSTDKRDVEDICADIARLLPELGYVTAPVTDVQPERIKAREAEFRAIWALSDLRNDRIRAATGVAFRPLDDSIRDCVESLIAIGGVRVRTDAGAASDG